MRKHWKSKLFLRTFFSYIFVILLPVLIFCGVLYQQISDKNKHQYRERGQYVIKTIDDKFLELNHFGNKLMSTQWLQRMRSSSPIIYNDYFTHAKKREVGEELRFYGSVNNFTNEITIFLLNRKIAVNSSAWWDIDSYLLKKNLDNTDASLFLKDIQEDTKFRILSSRYEKNTSSRNFYLVQGLDNTLQNRAVLVMQVNAYLLDDFIAKNRDVVSLDILVNSTPVYRYQNNSMEPSKLSVTIPSQTNNDISYCVVLSQEPLVSQVSTILFILLAFAGVIFSFFTAYMLAIFSYKPIRALADKLGDIGKKSELTAIEKSFSSLMQEKEEFVKLSEKYYDSAREQTLQQLLLGYFQNQKIELLSNEFNIYYSEEANYQVVLIAYEKKENDFLLKVLVNIKAFLQIQNYNIELVSNIDGYIALIYQFIEPHGSNDVFLQLNQLEKHLIEKTQAEPILSIGDVEKSIIGISKSYQSAKEKALGYQFQGISTAFLKKNQYYFPTDWEMQLLNQLKIGDEASALAVLEELKEENTKRQILHSEWLVLVGTIFDDLRRITYELTMDSTSLEESFYTKARELRLDKQWLFLQKTIENICRRTEYSGNSERESVGTEILQYLEENFVNPDLSLQYLADEFNLSTSTISRIFKNIIKVNFHDFLSRLRMEKAKKLLKEKNKTITEIGVLVGYENAYSFNRAFQRYEGIRPKEYMDRQ